MEEAYLDNNATAPLLPAVFEAMRPYFGERFGNPSSACHRGREAYAAVEEARQRVASLLGASPQEIVFTSGGSEGDTTAILGLVSPGDHVITTAIEHHAVLHSCKRLERAGASVTYLPVDAEGRVDPDAVRAALRPTTRLVSVMTANNETGVLQPVEEIGRVAAEAGVCFHTDAVQAAGKVPVDVARIGCALLTISGHKLHGPPGVGAQYVRRGTFPRPLIQGGPQERGFRAGTENLPAIVGLGMAASLAREWLVSGAAAEMRAQRDRVERTVLERIPASRVNGAGAPRVPNTASLLFEGISGKALVLGLDLHGICVSTGSACSTASSEPPYVLRAMGLSPEDAYATIRMSLGKQTTSAEVDQFLRCLPDAVAHLRALSPSWSDRSGGSGA
ncbi:MAG TPA: aminotransferase class V-fold PLP-dependent enzyme [Anaeromyxobacter sp.]|nr:aminotransferase class V-fold PLP-dependent enzyme [Anaeromyxobacter sp.]